MNQPRFVSGLWEYVWPTRGHGGYLNAYEIADWDIKRAPAAQHGHRRAPVVTRPVMEALVSRQAELHDLPRAVVQRDSYHTPAGEIFPGLDHLSWDGGRVRVDGQHLLEPMRNDAEPRLATTSFHLAPDVHGLYHLDLLGWDLRFVRTDARILRPVTGATSRDVDDVQRAAVEAVERGELHYDGASRALLVTVTLMARRQTPVPPRAPRPEVQPRPGPSM